MPQKGIVDPNLEKLIRDMASHNERAYTSRTDNNAVPFMRPAVSEDTEWDGDIQTKSGLKDIHRAFNTDVAEDALISAFTPKDPGNSSDGIVLSLQIDYAAQAERAFRARHTQSFPRALAHYSTREKGHGQAEGALTGQALDYFTHIIKQGSEGEGDQV